MVSNCRLVAIDFQIGCALQKNIGFQRFSQGSASPLDNSANISSRRVSKSPGIQRQRIRIVIPKMALMEDPVWLSRAGTVVRAVSNLTRRAGTYNIYYFFR